MYQICSQVFLPQETHLFSLALVYPRHAKRCAQEFARIRAIDVCHPHNHQVQSVDLGEVFLSLELPLCQI